MSAKAQLIEFGPYFTGGNLVTDLKIWHYEPGTTTLRNVWTDRDKGSTAAQPVAGDANGIASFFADGLYKFVVKNDTTTLYTLDNFAVRDAFPQVTQVDDYADFATAISTIGSSVVTLLISSSQTVASNVTVPSNVTLWFVQTGDLSIASGKTVTINGPVIAEMRKIYTGAGSVAFGAASRVRTVYPQWWGAVGDGSNDDTTAIQAAITAAGANFAGSVYLPHGTYKTTASLVISKAITFVGDSDGGTIINGTGLASGGIVLDVDGTINPNLEQVVIGHLTLMSNNDAPDLLRLKRVANSRVHNLAVRNARYGVLITGDRTFGLEFERVIYTTGAMTNTIRFSNPAGGNFTFTHCSFGGTTGVYQTSDSTGMGTAAFLSNIFEAATAGAVQFDGKINTISFFGNHFEKNVGYAISINPPAATISSSISIVGNFIETDNGPNGAINLCGTTVYGFSVISNYFEGYGAAAVRLNGTGEYGEIVGNYVDHASNGVVNARRDGVVVSGNRNQAGALEDAWGSALSGFEQGTWTPNDASGASLTFSTATGRYTRLGRVVFWQAQVTYPATANGSAAKIGGLPKTIAAGTVGRAGGTVSHSTEPTLENLWQIESTTRIELFAADATIVTNATMSGDTIYLAGSYTIE